MPEIDENTDHITDTKDVLNFIHELEMGKNLDEIRDKYFLSPDAENVSNDEIISFIGEEYMPTSDKVFSFYYDFPYIFSAFLKEYGINLLTDKLHWKVFVMLFSGLGKENSFAEIIRLRCSDFSDPKERIFQKRFNSKHDKRREGYAI